MIASLRFQKQKIQKIKDCVRYGAGAKKIELG